jgi:hypothetical protein
MMAFNIGITLDSRVQLTPAAPYRAADDQVMVSVNINPGGLSWGYLQGPPEDLERLASVALAAAKMGRELEANQTKEVEVAPR